jgi:hypothetical protein
VIRGVSTELVERFLEEGRGAAEPPSASPRGARASAPAPVAPAAPARRPAAPAAPRHEAPAAGASPPVPRGLPLAARPPGRASVAGTAFTAALALVALVGLRPPLPEPRPGAAAPAPVLAHADAPEPRAPEADDAARDPRGARRAIEPLQVQVNAIPWALVEIDGVDMGMTPRAGIPLLPGPHRFRARMPDGRVLERTVEIGPRNRHVVFE